MIGKLYKRILRNRVSTIALQSACLGIAVSALTVDMAAAQVDEITVYATKRETNLQTTAVSVSAIQEEAVNRIVARDLGDIAVLAPGFSAAKVTGFNAASFSMRGAAQTDIIVYSEPQVAVVIDDFVVPHVQTQLLDMFDIEQIEVLRGPQGTLFGKNATGGVVTVRTKKPVIDEKTLEVNYRYASFDRHEIRAAANMPIGDTLAVRLSGLYVNSDGYYTNGAEYGPVTPFGPIDAMGANINPFVGATGRGDGSSLGGEDVFSGRGKVLWQPTDNFSALFQYEIIRDNSDDVPSVNDTPAGSPLFVWNLLGLTQDPGDPLDNAASTNRDSQLLNMGDGHQVDVDGYYLNLDWDFGPYSLVSVTGYREQESRLPSTYTGEVGPVSLFDANRADDRETFQQEVRVSREFGDVADVVVGGFYQFNNTTFCVVQVLGFLDLLGLTLPFGTFNDNAQILCNAQDAQAAAGFVDGNIYVTDRFTVGGGVRLTWENKEWIGRNQVFFQALDGGFDPTLTADSFSDPLEAADFDRFPAGVLSDEEDWVEPSWRATASYQLTDDIFGYFTVASSFKSGSYNDQSGTTGNPLTPAGIAPTDPETVISYEGGLKTDWFDGQLRFNGAFFYAEYSEAQRQIAATLTNEFGEQFQETRFFNAAEVTVKGIELEANWAPPIEGLTFNGNFSWLDGEFNRFEADTDFDGTIDVDFSGRPLNRAPEFQGAIQANYERPITDTLEVLLSVLFSYESENVFNYSDLGSEFDTVLDEKTLLSLNLTLSDVDDRFFARFFAHNLTDDRYRVSSQPVADLWVFSQYGAPRTFGLEVGFALGG